jgi:NADPH:quinone reductase-like Zn-dependent oxidoreductase
MRSLVSTPNGPSPAEIQEVPEPVPGPGEALIEVKAASLNRGELNLLPNRPGWRPGQDVAGVVMAAAAGGDGPPVGTRVVAAVDQGGWAERVPASINRLAGLPDGVSFEAGATLPVAGLTAIRALRAAGGPLLGMRLLVTGASGGVGRFAVQLGRQGGATVTAAAAAPERAAGLTELGAASVLYEGREPEGQFDVVLEAVGGPSLERSLRALAPRGVVVLYGGASGVGASIGLSSFVPGRFGRIQSFFIYETDVQTFGRDLAYLVSLMDLGQLEPQVGLTVSWKDLGSAVSALRDRKVNGKAVLLID